MNVNGGDAGIAEPSFPTCSSVSFALKIRIDFSNNNIFAKRLTNPISNRCIRNDSHNEFYRCLAHSRPARISAINGDTMLQRYRLNRRNARETTTTTKMYSVGGSSRYFGARAGQQEIENAVADVSATVAVCSALMTSLLQSEFTPTWTVDRDRNHRIYAQATGSPNISFANKWTDFQVVSHNAALPSVEMLNREREKLVMSRMMCTQSPPYAQLHICARILLRWVNY